MRFALSGILIFAFILTGDHYQEARPQFPWVFTELAELDTGNPEAEVGEIWGRSEEVRTVSVDARGTVSLLDLIYGSITGGNQFRGIHRFDRTGRWTGNLSREGDGPGEFRSPTLITADGRGDLVLYDTAGSKVTQLDPEGGYVVSFGIRNLINTMIEAVHPAGTDRYWLVSIHPVPSARPFDEPLQEDILLVSPEGRTFWSRQYDGIRDQLFITFEGNPYQAFPFPNPSARVARWTFDDEGAIWILSPDSDRLIRIDPRGETTADITLSLEPIELDRNEIRRFIDERTERLSTSPREREREYVDEIARRLRDLRSSFAPVQRLWWIGPEGFLVDRVPVDPMARGWREGPGRYLALFPDGTISDEIDGPGGLITVTNGYAVALRSDLSDLPKLILYRIAPDTSSPIERLRSSALPRSRMPGRSCHD